MKKILLSLLGILIMHIANAQDTIVLRNNTVIKAKVIEIGTTEIKYKKIENLDGPTYNIRKSEVQMVKYENGTSDVFTIDIEKAPKPGSAKARQYKGSAVIYAAISAPLGSFADSQEGAALLGWGIGLNGASSYSDGIPYVSYQVSYANHLYEVTGYDQVGNKYIFQGDYNLWHFMLGIGSRTKPSALMVYFNVMGGLNYTVLTGTLTQFGYSNAGSLAVSLGAGVIISRNLNLGLKYLHTNATFKNSNSTAFNAEQKISVLQVIGGYQF
jgi:hypothetical protein